jgi:hypothetical protein
MSSVQSVIAQAVRVPSKYTNISTPSYNDSFLNNNYVPIPFVIVNQTLDINITNSDVQSFINNGSSPDDESEYQAQLMGGKRLITSLGPNFVTYLNNFIQVNDSLGSPYSGELLIYVNPVMTKAQIAQPNNVNALEFENVFGVNDVPPTSDQYVGGEFSNNYYTSWVFYSPLTIRYSSAASSSGYRYITFTTHYDGN